MAAGDPILEMTRVIDAPRDAVFARWLDPDHLIRWWAAPRPVKAAPPRTGQPGESYRFRVRAPGGGDRWLHVAYREVVAPSHLVFTWGGDAAATIVTVAFTERAGRTTITLRQTLAAHPVERLYQARLDRLAAFLGQA